MRFRLLPSCFTVLLALSCGWGGGTDSSSSSGGTTKQEAFGMSTFLPNQANGNSASSGASSASSALRGLELPYLPETENNTIIEHMGYTLSYNSSLRIPNWVAYELQDSELYGDFERAERFAPDPLIKGRQAYDSDYVGSGWDRGHMAPSGDMKWSSQAMKECFYLTNVCPQNHNLNSGAWNDLEKQIRYECRYYKKIWIVAGPIVGRNLYGTIGENKVIVPDAFFKALLARKKNGNYTAVAFIFPNESGCTSIADYAMSVDELEEELGMDLFYNLPYDIQEKVEAKYNLKDWRINSSNTN